MTKALKPIRMDTQVWELKSSLGDARAISSINLLQMLEQLLLIRRFEERLLEISIDGLLNGPAHASIGQEGAAVGAISVLSSGDRINGTHRMHHQFLAKALNHSMPNGYNPLSDAFPTAMTNVVRRTYAEILGLKTGYCGGRGGSMHLRYPEAGILGSNAIVGGNPSHAVGYAFADTMLQQDAVSVAFFGDGAAQTGAFYEAMNLAALYNTPTIFFIENNLYAVSTHLREQTRETCLAGRGLALGVPGIRFDGMDVIAARRAMEEACRMIRENQGPVVLEALTYRYMHQSGALQGSAFGYRDKREEDQWAKRDPVLTLPALLKRLDLIDGAGIEHLRTRADAQLTEVLGELIEQYGDQSRQRIFPALWPDPITVEHHIRGDLRELSGIPVLEAEAVPADRRQSMRFIDTISQAMLRNMERDERIVIFGEDVHRLRGGTAGATKGIGERFPERLIGTPICENGFTGLALGAALNGLRPVVEIMYADFCLVAADQLFNQIAKVQHMFGGGFPVPVVVRSRISPGTGYGSQHSMDASGLFTQYPGWRIVGPSTPHDYIGLLNAALACDDPVLIVEYSDLFRDAGDVTLDDWNYIIPFGKARVARAGNRCTLLTYGSMVKTSLAVAEKTGIDVEIIDLRTLDPLGLDWNTIETSVKKTGALLIVEQTTRGTSIGSRIVSDAQRRLFDWLDHEILHITGTDSSPVVSKVLEQAAFAGSAQVEEALMTIVSRTGVR